MPALALLARIPIWAYLLAAALAWGGWQSWQRQAAQGRLLELEARIAQAQAEAERERAQAVKEATDHATKKTAAATRAAADARDAADRLRRHLVALAQASGGTAGVSEAACASDRSVLADVLGRCTASYQRLAAYADSARIAGETCERASGAVR